VKPLSLDWKRFSAAMREIEMENKKWRNALAETLAI
jgi:hypothetical protein